MLKKVLILSMLNLFLVTANAGVVVYDSQGFENFALGSAHGQTGVYYLHEGATSDGAFEVKTGNTETTMTVVDSGTDRGNVLSINQGDGGWTHSWLQIGWAGNNSDNTYQGQTSYMHMNFDFYNTGVSGALTTWRSGNATTQAKVWVQENMRMNVRKDSTSAGTGPYDVEPNSSLNTWHNFQLTMKWEGPSGTSPVIYAFLDGVELNVPDEDNTWYSVWGGWTGYMDALSFNYLVNEAEPLLIDNLQMEYSDSMYVIPEPATITLLVFGTLSSVLLKKRRTA